MSAKGRFKSSLFGYRRREVDEAVSDLEIALKAAGEGLGEAERMVVERDAELESQRQALARGGRRVEELERISARLAERVVERERELRAVRDELERARADGEEGMRTLAALAEDLQSVRRQARGQATRMRMKALREAADLAGRAGEIAEQPGDAGERLIDALQDAIARIGGEDEEPVGADASASANGHAQAEPGELFEGLVEVDVGPLSDFSQLVGFEDAANGIGATSEISVKRFKQGRATLAMRFKHPVELLRELEERAPFEFVVRDMRSDRVILDVDDEG